MPTDSCFEQRTRIAIWQQQLKERKVVHPLQERRGPPKGGVKAEDDHLRGKFLMVWAKTRNRHSNRPDPCTAHHTWSASTQSKNSVHNWLARVTLCEASRSRMLWNTPAPVDRRWLMPCMRHKSNSTQAIPKTASLTRWVQAPASDASLTLSVLSMSKFVRHSTAWGFGQVS